MDDRFGSELVLHRERRVHWWLPQASPDRFVAFGALGWPLQFFPFYWFIWPLRQGRNMEVATHFSQAQAEHSWVELTILNKRFVDVADVRRLHPEAPRYAFRDPRALTADTLRLEIAGGYEWGVLVKELRLEDPLEVCVEVVGDLSRPIA